MNKRLALLCLIMSLICTIPTAKCIAKENYSDVQKSQAITDLLLNNSLNSLSASKYDQVCGYTTNDLIYDYKVIIPSKSLVCGKVSRTKKASRFSRNAKLNVELDQIMTSDGNKIEIADDIDFKITVNKQQSQFRRNLPAGVAYLGTYLPLELASSICSGGVNAIGLGAGVVVGGGYGAFYPEQGKGRKISALNGAINATPIGLIRFIAKKGENFDYKIGDAINVKFSKKDLVKLNKISTKSNQL